MRSTRVFSALALLIVLIITMGPEPAVAAGSPMKLVGALNPWKNGQFSNEPPMPLDTSPTWVRSTTKGSP